MPEIAELNHFTYGLINPGLSYAFSVLGSLLALICTARAQTLENRARRARWLLLAAWALGGTGIWVMHFTAMLGFSVPDSPVRYDVTLTVISWVAAIVMVGFGLFVAGLGKPTAWKVILGGLFAGSGVMVMHYFGMAAMHVNGSVGHDRRFVVLAGAIAVIAATVALWFTVTLRRGAALVVAALIMGVAVNGMHYTGMAGLRIHLHPDGGAVTGIPALSFLGPMMIFVILVVITLAYAMLRSTDIDTGWTYREQEDPPAPTSGFTVPKPRSAPRFGVTNNLWPETDPEEPAERAGGGHRSNNVSKRRLDSWASRAGARERQ